MLKEKVYNLIAHSGIWFLSKFFPEYFAVEPLRPTDRYTEYPFVLSHIPPPPAKILDVGCSGSMFPLILKALGYETHGIDIRNYFPLHKFFFKRGDICLAPYENETFDVITAVSSIEHIGLGGRYGAEEVLEGDLKALCEIHRILKKGKFFICTLPFGEDLRIEKDHKIYNRKRLDFLFENWEMWHMDVEQSPEADYKLALIYAVK